MAPKIQSDDFRPTVTKKAQDMTDERIADLMGWPAFMKLEQYGPEDLVTRLKNLVATAEREEREAIIANIPGGCSVDPQAVCDMIRERNGK